MWYLSLCQEFSPIPLSLPRWRHLRMLNFSEFQSPTTAFSLDMKIMLQSYIDRIKFLWKIKVFNLMMMLLCFNVLLCHLLQSIEMYSKDDEKAFTINLRLKTLPLFYYLTIFPKCVMGKFQQLRILM